MRAGIPLLLCHEAGPPQCGYPFRTTGYLPTDSPCGSFRALRIPLVAAVGALTLPASAMPSITNSRIRFTPPRPCLPGGRFARCCRLCHAAQSAWLCGLESQLQRHCRPAQVHRHQRSQARGRRRRGPQGHQQPLLPFGASPVSCCAYAHCAIQLRTANTAAVGVSAVEPSALGFAISACGSARSGSSLTGARVRTRRLR
jgi:hypothetical protein